MFIRYNRDGERAALQLLDYNSIPDGGLCWLRQMGLGVQHPLEEDVLWAGFYTVCLVLGKLTLYHRELLVSLFILG